MVILSGDVVDVPAIVKADLKCEIYGGLDLTNIVNPLPLRLYKFRRLNHFELDVTDYCNCNFVAMLFTLFLLAISFMSGAKAHGDHGQQPLSPDADWATRHMAGTKRYYV